MARRRNLVVCLVALAVLVASPAFGKPATAGKPRAAKVSTTKASTKKPANSKTHAVRKASARREGGSAAATSYFMAADPHVPLAIVREGAVEDAVAASSRGKSCGKKSRWATRGAAWHAIDAWGQFAGKATIEEIDPYDVTGCDEVIFAPKFDRNSGHLLFVSADSAYRPAASLKWQAPYQATNKFRALVERSTTNEGQTKKRKQPWRCTDLREPSRFFEVLTPSGDKQKLAVGGADSGYVIARYEDGQWVAEHTQHNSDKTPMCFRPISVFDMNADGQPEVVLRFVEGDGETWGEFVLSRSANGKWKLVATSPGGSTA